MSPIDTEARAGAKSGAGWVGYKVHLTETCDEELPHIITNVETTAAPATDEAALAPIHAALAGRELLPSEHLVDAGYVDSTRVVESTEQYQLRLIGPIGVDSSWQAKAGQGYAAADFSVDWTAQRLTCPAGEQSVRWREGQTGYGQAVIHGYFAARTCSKCPARAQCTKTERAGRVVSIQPQARYEALQAGRKEQRQKGLLARVPAAGRG